MTSLEDIPLPSSVHTEVVILGAMLLDAAAIADVSSTLETDDFSLDSHRRIYRAILSLLADGLSVDLATVRARLEQRQELAAIGGPGYLAYLTEGIPHHINIDSYLRIVVDKSLSRRAMAIHHNAYVASQDPQLDPFEFIERSIDNLQQLMGSSPDNDIERVGDYLAAQPDEQQFFDHLATVDGLRLGFPGLDELVGGAQPAELWIVAARPSMGKTAWACNVAHNVAVGHGKVCAFFSLEQKRKAMIRRMLASSSRIDYREIRDNTLDRLARAHVLDARQRLAQAPLYLDDQHGLTVTRIKTRCARLQRTAGLDLVIVDQLSKIASTDVYKRGMQMREIVGAQSGALKRMAQDLNVPVIVFNQLSRETGKRSDPKPRLEDLKESGNIEEDADVVTFLHRPDYYDKSDESLRGAGQMIVAKNREGQTGTVECSYHGRIMRWQDDTQPAAHQESFASAYGVP